MNALSENVNVAERGWPILSAHVRRWSLVVGYVVRLAIASLLPSAGESGGGWDSVITPAQQNLLHIPAYLVLTVLTLYAGISTESIRWGRVLVLVVLCVAYGALLEWLQASLIPGRIGSATDFLLNTVGVAIGVCVWLAVRRRPQCHQAM